MNPAGKVRILVVDDHFIVRTGLLALIHTEPNLAVVGEAADGDEAIKLFESQRPDLMLIDLRMPGKSGHEVSRHIRRLAPETAPAVGQVISPLDAGVGQPWIVERGLAIEQGQFCGTTFADAGKAGCSDKFSVASISELAP